MQRLLRHQQCRPRLSKILLQVTRAPLFYVIMRANVFPSIVAAAGTLMLSNASLAGRAPEIPTKPVSTEYHGVTVEDRYQWLENDDEPQVKAWSDAQNRRTRTYLDSLPDRAAIETQLKAWYAKTSPNYFSLV